MHRLLVIQYQDGNYPPVNIGIVASTGTLMHYRVTPSIYLLSERHDEYRSALSRLIADLNTASKDAGAGTWHYLRKYLETHIRDKCFMVSDTIDVPNLDFDVMYRQLIREVKIEGGIR